MSTNLIALHLVAVVVVNITAGTVIASVTRVTKKLLANRHDS